MATSPIVNFTTLDYDQIRASLQDYLRANSNFTDYDFEGSNLSVILDVLAYNTYTNAFIGNMLSNEVFLDSATLRENVVSAAREIGYLPRSATAARANISFFVDTSSYSYRPVSLTLKKGLVCSSSAFGNESYAFSILNDITVPVSNNLAFFDSIDVIEGSFVTDNFTQQGIKPAPPQRFILDNPGIDTSTITVVVRDNKNSSRSNKFIFADNLFNVTSTSKIFFVQEVEDQRYELIFGDGIFGEALQDQNFIEVSYVVTNQKEANGVSSFSFIGRLVDNNNNSITSGISLLTTNKSSSGGKEIESINSIKNLAPKNYSAQGRCVTPEDYEAIIPRIYPESESVSAYGGETLVPPQYGKVFITIKPFYGNFVPNSIKDNLKRKLSKYAVTGIVPEIIDLKYLFIEFVTNVYYNPNLASSVDQIKTIVTNNIQSYSNSRELNGYGARFKYSKFQKLIDDSHPAITSNITNIQIRRDLKAQINTFANYEICFGNGFHIKDPNGYNIKSSGFKVSGISDVVYLADIPTDSSTGVIILFTNSTNPLVIRNNVGTIDYLKGEIKISSINIITTTIVKDNQNFIEISVSPSSNDVIGLQDLYLQLDVSKSVVNIILDEVSSGGDISGTTYIMSSSYSDNSITR
jgi:hypothetical protein